MTCRVRSRATHRVGGMTGIPFALLVILVASAFVLPATHPPARSRLPASLDPHLALPAGRSPGGSPVATIASILPQNLTEAVPINFIGAGS